MILSNTITIGAKANSDLLSWIWNAESSAEIHEKVMKCELKVVEQGFFQVPTRVAQKK